MQSLLRLLQKPLIRQLLEPLEWRLDFLTANVYFVYHHQSTGNWCSQFVVMCFVWCLLYLRT